MLRINLLPGYVLLRRRNRQVGGLFAGIFVLVTAGSLIWWASLRQQPAELAAKVEQGTEMQQKITDLQTKAAAVITDLGQINTNYSDYQSIQKYNLAYPELYERVASYTSSRVIYNQESVSNTTLSISGYTHSLGDLGRYLQMMYAEPDASAVSLTSAIPGPGSPNPDVSQTYSIPAGVTAKLQGYSKPINNYTVKKGAIIAVNQGGASGGGFGGGQPSFGRPSFGPTGGGPQFGPPRGLGGGPQFGGMTGAPTVGGQTEAARPFDARHDGFPFSVAITLKQALAPPTVGGSGAAGSAGIPGGGPPGGFGGPPGGYGPPGGPPRGFGAPPGGSGNGG